MDARGEPVSGSIAELEAVELGGVRQWILVRGRDHKRPILLFLHGGPGMPSMYLHHGMSRRLEEDFVVVHWDRRGAGKSAPAAVNDTIRVSRLVEDTCALAQMLSARYDNGPVVLVGHSWGTYLGMLAIQNSPELFRAYVGIGQLAGPGRRDPESDELQRSFILTEARARGVTEGLGDLDSAGTREHWLFRFGAVLHGADSYWPLLWLGLTAPEYTLGDAWRLQQSVKSVADHMVYDAIPDRLDRAVTRVAVPVWFFTGRYDYTDPVPITERYFATLSAPEKTLVWFERSAHFPFLEESEAFADAIAKVAAATVDHPRGAAPR